MQLRETVLDQNMSTFPRIILAAEEHLAEGRFVPAEGTLNNEKVSDTRNWNSKI
jgi:hypothetical protein